MQEVLDRFKDLRNTPDYKRIITKDAEFEDKQFRPKFSSIFSSTKSKFSTEKKEKWMKRIEWKRLSKIYEIDEITIVDNISSSDVEQGEIGDCYFMSTLSSLAQQQPLELKKLFITTKVNRSGGYAMQLLVNGCYQTVVVDDFIPYDIISKCPVFANKKTKNIWPILLEKAWAKINGSYENIVTGSSCEALKFLMPYPVERCEDKKEEEIKVDIWEKIQSAIHEKYMITCASGEGDVAESDEIIDKLGLARNHCFSITGQYSLSHNGKEEKLLKISNPWNKQEWKGKWSDKDNNWTKSNKLNVKFENKSPGEFFISFKDYLKYFDSTTICKLDPFYDQCSLRLTHQKGSYGLVKIVLPVKSHLIVRVSQIMERLFPEKLKYKSAYMRVMLGRATNDTTNPIQYITGGFQTYSDSFYVESPGVVEKGTYYVYVELDWTTDLINEFALGVLGYDIAVNQIKHSECPNFLEEGIKDYARNHVTKYRSKEQEVDFKAKFGLGDKTAGYGFHYYENYSKIDTTIIESLRYTKMEGIEFQNPSEKFLTEIPPGTTKVLIFKRISSSCSTNYGYNTYFKYSAKHLAHTALKTGKKGEINCKDGSETNMAYYYTGHDFGYTFVFVNNNKDLTLDEYLMFDKLDNLQLTAADRETSDDQPFWKFTVKPGEKVVKHLRKRIIDAGFSMSYQSSHEFLKPGQPEYSIKERHAPEKLTEKELINILKLRGEKQKFKCPKTNKEIEISYGHIFFKTYYAWYFENAESKYTFDGDFTFNLQNLKLEKPEGADKNNWNIVLKPGDRQLRKIIVENSDDGVSFSVSTSYYIKY